MSRKPASSRTKASKQPRARTKKRTARNRAESLVDMPLERFVDAGALALRLPLKPEWRPAVVANLQIILRLSALVDECSLPDEAEPAPVFRA
jgi:hypothetical protein